MAGVRTKMKSYASCALFSIDDTLASIFANNSAIGMATASRYGIGINPSRIRANNAPVKGGQVLHTGPIPFLKMYESTVKSCHQNGLRGGGGTANFAWFHYDILDILVLKNNAGTDDNRVRKLDYAIGLDKLILERYIKGQDITLFSYHECPELWNNFGLPNFRELYEKAESNPSLKFKKKIPAKDFIDLLVKERFETGRIYILFVDHANEHGAWLEHVDTTNLCVHSDSLLSCLVDEFPRTISIEEVTSLFNSGKDIKVLSKNINTDAISYETVTNASKTGEFLELIEITDLDTNKTLRCTANHKVYTRNRGYVQAKDLIEEDVLDLV
jgi:ribonucleotide reductase alpha subunit